MESAVACDFKEEISVLTKYGAFYTGGGIQITQDGRFMLCCYGDRVKVVDIISGKVEATIGEKENDELTCFVLSNDDRILVAAAKNGILVQWDFKERTMIKTWKSVHTGPVACMAFDSTSTLLATGGSDSTIKVWDTVRMYYTHNLKGAEGVFSVICFYQNDSDLIVFGAAADYKIRAWSLDSSKCISVLEGHYSTVTSLQFCGSKNVMISGGRDKVVLLWSLLDFTLLKTIPVYESIESVILIPEGRCLPKLNVENEDITFITACSKGILKVWDSATGRCIHSQEDSLASVLQDEDEVENEQIIITQAFYSKALDAIGIVTFEHNIMIHKLEDFSLFKQFVGYNDEVLDIKVMGKKERYLAVATNSPLIRIYEISTFACQLLKGHTDIVVSLDVFSKDRNMLISGSKDNSVLVWRMDPDTGEVRNLFMGYGHTHNVSAVACCKNNPNFFLSASDDTTLKVWDVPAKKPLVALKSHLSVRCTVRAHDKTINSISVSINDKLVATGSQDHTAKIWNATDLSLLGVMRGHRKGVTCVEFSPVDLVLATASKDGTVKIWSLADFSMLKIFEEHQCAVQTVIFLSKGTQLLSSSCSGDIKLWGIKGNECIQNVTEHTGEVWALTATLKEDFIISGGADSNIIMWKDVTQEKHKEEIEKHKHQILYEQQLFNLIHEKKWVEALGLALTLDNPFRALRIVETILLTDDGQSKLHDTVIKLKSDQMDNLLKYVAEWNTSPSRGALVLLILNSILRIKTPEELCQMQVIKDILQPLLLYTERNLERFDRLTKETPLAGMLCRNVNMMVEHDEADEMDTDREFVDLNATCTVSCK